MRASPKGTKKKRRKKGFGNAWRREVTLVELGRRSSNLVFINLRVHGLSCESKRRGVHERSKPSSPPEPHHLKIDRTGDRDREREQ